jgi:hypothetical protein
VAPLRASWARKGRERGGLARVVGAEREEGAGSALAGLRKKNVTN